MSKEVIAQYLADMEKDDFVFVHPTTEKEAEPEDSAKEAEVAATASSWADEVEEEMMAAEDQDAKQVGSWAAVAAAPVTPKPTGRWSNWISHRKCRRTCVNKTTKHDLFWLGSN